MSIRIVALNSRSTGHQHAYMWTSSHFFRVLKRIRTHGADPNHPLKPCQAAQLELKATQCEIDAYEKEITQ